METQLEVGKWYRFVWKSYDNSWYYGKLEDVEEHLYSWSIWFKLDGSNFQLHPSFIKSELGECHLLTDLSDIQLFLPDGHVDKFTTKLEYVKCVRAKHIEYEVGKIYKVEDDRRVRNKNGYLPHDSLNENLKDFYVSYDFIPSTKEEFDKQNQQEWIPQVGDWVVLQKSKDNWATKMNELVGKCVQITDINKTHKTSIKFKEKDCYGWCLEDKHFRKALPHELPDNFVLPEKWCIKWINEEVFNACSKYFNKNWFYCICSWSISDAANYWSYIEKDSPTSHGYTEITLEQFKKYVLKEDSDVDKTIKVLNTTGSMMYDTTEENVHWLNGRYLKVIDSTTIDHYPCKRGDYH